MTPDEGIRQVRGYDWIKYAFSELCPSRFSNYPHSAYLLCLWQHCTSVTHLLRECSDNASAQVEVQMLAHIPVAFDPASQQQCWVVDWSSWCHNILCLDLKSQPRIFGRMRCDAYSLLPGAGRGLGFYSLGKGAWKAWGLAAVLKIRHRRGFAGLC